MVNGDEKDPDDQYPPEFEYLNEIVGEKTAQLQQINKQISDMPKTPPDILRLRYDVPGSNKALQDTKNMQGLGSLERMRDSLEKDVKERVEAEIRGIDPETADYIRRVTDEKINPNPFKGKSDAELDKINPMQKDLDHSQNFMVVRMKNARNVEKAASDPVPVESQSNVEKTPEKSDTFASERFSQSLSYRVNVNFSDNTPAKQITPVKDRSGPGKE